MDNDIKPVGPAQTPQFPQPAGPYTGQPVQPAPGAAPVQATVSAPEPPKPEKKSGGWRGTLSTILIILIAPALALSITAFVFQSYQVDGDSMSTTLSDHDRLIIWKVPRTWSRLTNHDFIPNRGDVIVFVKRGLYEGDSSKEKQLIKRVIALPGERVTVRDNVVTVYNKQYPSGFFPDKSLPYGKNIPTTPGVVDTTVPAGEVFVIGDNRGNSYDSRYFGAIPANDIVGKLIARVLPLSDAEKF